MLSYKSMCNFVLVNSFLLTLAFAQYNSMISINLTILLRNYILLAAISYGTRTKSMISERPSEKMTVVSHIYVISSSFVEAETLNFLMLFINYNSLYSSLYTICLFIPRSFLFELVFDFQHYWIHRLMHINRFLYVNIHKIHHSNIHPTAIDTYLQHPVDVLLTTSIPTITSFFILYTISPVSKLELYILMVYKSYLEVSGHLGKQTYPSSSFSQFIWLPRFFNIQLYGEDHDLHHSANNCNYAKRFSIWDKVFGTHTSIQ